MLSPSLLQGMNMKKYTEGGPPDWASKTSVLFVKSTFYLKKKCIFNDWILQCALSTTLSHLSHCTKKSFVFRWYLIIYFASLSQDLHVMIREIHFKESVKYLLQNHRNTYIQKKLFHTALWVIYLILYFALSSSLATLQLEQKYIHWNICLERYLLRWYLIIYFASSLKISTSLGALQVEKKLTCKSFKTRSQLPE